MFQQFKMKQKSSSKDGKQVEYKLLRQANIEIDANLKTKQQTCMHSTFQLGVCVHRKRYGLNKSKQTRRDPSSGPVLPNSPFPDPDPDPGSYKIDHFDVVH